MLYAAYTYARQVSLRSSAGCTPATGLACIALPLATVPTPLPPHYRTIANPAPLDALRNPQAQALGLPPSTPLLMALSTDPGAATPMAKRSPLEEARAPSPDAPAFPIPKHVDDLTRFTTMPADHRNYALVWVTLCVALGLMARQAVVKPPRGPRIVDVDDTAREAWKASQAS